MNRATTLAIVGVLGYFAYKKYGGALAMSAEGTQGFKTIVDRIRTRFSPSDLEQVSAERSGATVDRLPINYSPAASQAGHFAFDKTTPVINDAPFGPGVSDVKISVQDAYADNLRAEDFQVFNAEAVGQEMVPSSYKQLKSIQPTTLDESVRPVSSYDSAIASLESGRLSLPLRSGSAGVETITPAMNDSYTDGSTTRSMSEWKHDGEVDMINGGSAIFRPHMGGTSRRLRRV
jgi:hypothetical protein